MEEVTFHGEPPSNVLTMVVAFGGWIDAGEAATGALRSLVRQLGATPLASIDPEDSAILPNSGRWCADRGGGAHYSLAAQCVLDLAAARGGRGAVAVPGHGAAAAVAHLCHPAPGRRRACGVQRLVSLGAVLVDVPHTRPSHVTGSSTDPAWHAG